MTIMIPRGHENEDNFVVVKMGGRSYRIPKGKEVEWPMKPITNADRIRAMSDEELRNFLCGATACKVCAWGGWDGCELANWLKQPVEEVDDG